MKYLALLTFIAVVFIWLFNIQTLREVTELEKQLKAANETLEELDKDLDKKIIYYDSKLDLDKIKRYGSQRNESDWRSSLLWNWGIRC